MDFENFVLQLSPSDLIQIAGIIVSLICSLIAIAISLKTLKQNSKMIENSTRPYIGIYIASTYIRDVSCYLVVKNFGQSAATIRSFTYDFDLAKLNRSPSSRQLKKYKFFLPAEIYLLAVFMRLASKFRVFPLVLKFRDLCYFH